MKSGWILVEPTKQYKDFNLDSGELWNITYLFIYFI